MKIRIIESYIFSFLQLGLMWNYGKPNQEMRKFSVKTLKTFGFGEVKAAEGFLQDELNDFVKMWDEKREKQNNELYMFRSFKISTFNILWRVMAGQRFGLNDYMIKKLINAVEDVAKINIGLDPEWAFPILRFIPGLSPSRAKAKSFAFC